MVDSQLRWVIDDLPFELNEAPKTVNSKHSLRRLGDRRYLCLNFVLDASIGIVDNDEVCDQTQGNDL